METLIGFRKRKGKFVWGTHLGQPERNIKRPGTIDVTLEYVPWFFVSLQQRFGVTDIKAPSVCRSSQLRSWIDHVIALRSRMGHVISLRQISVTALFYLENSRKIHL